MTINRAVWTFAKTPGIEGPRTSFMGHSKRWESNTHALASWALSVTLGAKHYGERIFVCDEYGIDLLVHKLGLPFTNVRNILEGKIEDRFCTMGKVYAVQNVAEEGQPFVHFDGDYFANAGLPSDLHDAPVFAEVEDMIPIYVPITIERWEAAGLSQKLVGKWPPSKLFCMGAFGGKDTDFFTRWADAALSMMNDPENLPAWDSYPMKNVSQVAEEGTFGAFVEKEGTQVKTLFSSLAAQRESTQFIHATGPQWVTGDGIKKLLGPEWWERCERVAASL